MDGERNQQVQSGGADESPPGTHDLNLDLDRGDDFGQGELDDLDIEEYADGDEEGAGPGYRFPRGLADALDAIDLDDEVEEDWPEQPPSLDPDDATAGPILTGSPESEGHIQDGPDGVAVQHELQNEGEEASGEDSGLEAEGSRGALRTTGVFGATRRALAGLRRELAKQDQAASTSYNRSRGAVSADEGGELSEGAVEDIGAPESALSSPNTAPLDDPASITPSGAAAPETPREHALVASRGVFAGPSPLSLATPNLTSDRDELNDALAAFASLQPGQSGFIRVGLRSYPEFRGEAAEYVHATRHGTDPKAKSNPLSLLLFSIAWVVQAIWFHGNKNSNSFGNTPPPPPPWKKSSAVKPLNPSQMSDEARQALDDATKKSRDSSFFDTTLYIGVFGESDDRGALEQIRHDVETGFESYTTPHQRIVFEEVSGWDAAIGYMPSSPDGRLALSATEAGEIARIPDDLTNPHGVRVARSRVRQLPIANPITFDDPLNPPPGIIPVGKINSGTEDEAFIGIRNSELDRHALIAGRTGTGKSVLLEWLIFGIAKANYPVVLIDPHGSLADNVLHILADHCQERLDDIVVVDFADTEWPVAMNPLDINHFEQIEPTVKSVMEMLDRQMALGGGNAPRATTYARQAITVLAEANLHLKDPNTKCTLLQVNTFFNDEAFRQMVVQLCSNPSIRETFDPDNGPFEQLAPKAQLEYSAPIERAFRPLGASGALGNVFAAGENRLNFTELIRSNKIILLKLSRFAANKDVSTFVGSLVTPYMLQSMDDWGRKKDADSGEFVGTGARLIIDEAPTICGPGSSIMEVLSQARKWDMGAIAACQFPTQFDKAVEQEFYSNTASKITLALDPAGVGGLAQSISGDSGLVSKNDVISLPNYFGYANLMLPYGGSGPFSLATLAPIEPTRDASHRQRIEYVHQRSRALVCNQRDEVYARRQTQLADLKQALHRILAERVAQDAPEERSSVVNINPDEIEEQQWS